MRTKDLFTLLQEQGAVFTKPVNIGFSDALKLSHQNGDYTSIFDWCGDGLYSFIAWCKERVPGGWHIMLNTKEAMHLWCTIKVADQAVIRANRPADVDDGWMLSLAGVDIYEERLGGGQKVEGVNMVFMARALQLQRILLAHAKKDPPEGEAARTFLRCVGFGPPWEEGGS